MSEGVDFRRSAYAIIVLGIVLSVITAVVPFFGAGYRLSVGVLLIGLLPYVVYGAFTDVVRGWGLLVAGALILGINAGVTIPERLWHCGDYPDHAVYYAPLLSTFVVLPAILGLGAWWARRSRASAGPRTRGAHRAR